MSGRTVHECRERGNPDGSITKAHAQKHLAAVVDDRTTAANDELGVIPVRLGVASKRIAGEIITYQHEDSCLLETGCAVLQSPAAYTPSLNGLGVVPQANGQVSADADGVGTITGGGTREIDGTTGTVLYVRNII